MHARDKVNLVLNEALVSSRTLVARAPAARYSEVRCNFEAAKTRRESYLGKEYLVVPMVMITVGVHNGSAGPLYYPEDELSKTPESWNLKPLVVYHPQMNGQGISACSKEVVESQGIGWVMNTRYEATARQDATGTTIRTGRLLAEAWIDVDRCRAVDPRILENIEAGRMTEISTGLFTDNDAAPEGSVWNGEPYTSTARNYRPDHLAILPDQRGSCSLDDGAGLLRNQADDPTENAWSDEARRKAADARRAKSKRFAPGADFDEHASSDVYYMAGRSGSPPVIPNLTAFGHSASIDAKGTGQTVREKLPHWTAVDHEAAARKHATAAENLYARHQSAIKEGEQKFGTQGEKDKAVEWGEASDVRSHWPQRFKSDARLDLFHARINERKARAHWAAAGKTEPLPIKGSGDLKVNAWGPVQREAAIEARRAKAQPHAQALADEIGHGRTIASKGWDGEYQVSVEHSHSRRQGDVHKLHNEEVHDVLHGRGFRLAKDHGASQLYMHPDGTAAAVYKDRTEFLGGRKLRDEGGAAPQGKAQAPGGREQQGKAAAAKATAAKATAAKDQKAKAQERDERPTGNDARAEMPQVSDLDDCVDHLRGAGHEVALETAKVSTLRPLQDDINKAKVERLKRRGAAVLKKRRLLVSGDSGVIDGHHWHAALSALDPDAEIPVARVGLPAEQAIAAVRTYPGAEYRGIRDGKVTGNDAYSDDDIKGALATDPVESDTVTNPRVLLQQHATALEAEHEGTSRDADMGAEHVWVPGATHGMLRQTLRDRGFEPAARSKGQGGARTQRMTHPDGTVAEITSVGGWGGAGGGGGADAGAGKKRTGMGVHVRFPHSAGPQTPRSIADTVGKPKSTGDAEEPGHALGDAPKNLGAPQVTVPMGNARGLEEVALTEIEERISERLAAKYPRQGFALRFVSNRNAQGEGFFVFGAGRRAFAQNFCDAEADVELRGAPQRLLAANAYSDDEERVVGNAWLGEAGDVFAAGQWTQNVGTSSIIAPGDDGWELIQPQEETEADRTTSRDQISKRIEHDFEQLAKRILQKGEIESTTLRRTPGPVPPQGSQTPTSGTQPSGTPPFDVATGRHQPDEVANPDLYGANPSQVLLGNAWGPAQREAAAAARKAHTSKLYSKFGAERSSQPGADAAKPHKLEVSASREAVEGHLNGMGFGQKMSDPHGVLRHSDGTTAHLKNKGDKVHVEFKSSAPTGNAWSPEARKAALEARHAAAGEHAEAVRQKSPGAIHAASEKFMGHGPGGVEIRGHGFDSVGPIGHRDAIHKALGARGFKRDEKQPGGGTTYTHADGTKAVAFSRQEKTAKGKPKQGLYKHSVHFTPSMDENPTSNDAADGDSEHWIGKAIKKPGALRKALGAKKGEPIPAKKLEKAAAKGGKLGARARLAQTLRGMRKPTGNAWSDAARKKADEARKAHAQAIHAKLGGPHGLEHGEIKSVVTPHESVEKGDVAPALRAAGFKAGKSVTSGTRTWDHADGTFAITHATSPHQNDIHVYSGQPAPGGKPKATENRRAHADALAEAFTTNSAHGDGASLVPGIRQDEDVRAHLLSEGWRPAGPFVLSNADGTVARISAYRHRGGEPTQRVSFYDQEDAVKRNAYNREDGPEVGDDSDDVDEQMESGISGESPAESDDVERVAKGKKGKATPKTNKEGHVTKDEKIEHLIANSEAWGEDDRAQLELMSERQLDSIIGNGQLDVDEGESYENAGIDTGVQPGGKKTKSKKKPLKDHDEIAEDQANSGDVEEPNKATTFKDYTPGGDGKEKKAVANASLSPEDQEVLEYGRRQIAAERKSLIGKITGNSANTFKPEFLAKKPMPELRALAKLAAGQAPAQEPVANFLGAAGSDFEPTANAEAPAPMGVPAWSFDRNGAQGS